MNCGGAPGPPTNLQQRVVLLGASNIARSFSTIVGICQDVFATPLDIVTASGHGRCYGLESWVLGRTLPPILECGLWDALATRPSLETVTLLTDIGNDVVFGASPEQVATCVEQCLERLCPPSTRVIITELPTESILKLSAARFRLMRTVLFPRSILTHGVAMEHVRQLNERVVELANRFDAQLVRPEERWYGFDPIHVKPSYTTEAWRTILSAGSDGETPPARRLPFSQRWALCCLRQEHRRLFGIKQSCRQPCAKLFDGSLISLY